MPRVINPRPPIWIKNKSTTCPNIVQCVKVSATIRPVTHVALADVNNAVKKEVCSPDFVANGSIKRKAPIKMIMQKPPAISCIPDSRLAIFDNMIFFPF